VFWSVLFEWIGPKFMPHATGDPLDVIAYAAGAAVAGLWWQRDRWLKFRPGPELLTRRHRIFESKMKGPT
jgi:hypothetical protein